jgi:hypothetical protein
MATPKQSGLSPLAMVEGEEEQQKFAEVQQLQQQLKDALDYRKGFYLDPTMLALAQGFATPTKTGSFFESAGIAAGRVAEAQEAERKRAQEIAQMRWVSLACNNSSVKPSKCRITLLAELPV